MPITEQPGAERRLKTKNVRDTTKFGDDREPSADERRRDADHAEPLDTGRARR